MKNSHFTRQERHIILWLRFLTFSFLMVGLVFAFQPNYFLQYLDSVGLVFFNFQSHSLGHPQFEIWWILALSAMGAMTYAAFQAQSDWLRYHLLVPVIIISKAIAAFGFLAVIVFYPTHFFYIVAFVVDALLCLTTIYAYAQAIQSRSYSRLQ